MFKTFEISNYKFWADKEGLTIINAVCFLPNGICLEMPPTRADLPVRDVKEILWNIEEQQKLFETLQPKQNYFFELVSEKGGTEMIVNEELSLWDIKPVQPYLKIVQRQGDEESKQLNSRINMLIGRHITKVHKSKEAHTFREKYTAYCEYIASQRRLSSWERRAIYSYPPEYVSDYDSELSDDFSEDKSGLKIDMKVMLEKSTYSLSMPYDTYPLDIIKQVLKLEDFSRQLEACLKGISPADPNDYLLKVHGRLSFFLGEIFIEDGAEKYTERPFVRYKYVNDCLCRDKPIKLRVVLKSEVGIERITLRKMSTTEETTKPKSNHDKAKYAASLWDLKSYEQFGMRIVRIHNACFGELKLQVICGLYHGTEPLCECRKTSCKSGVDPELNELVLFDIALSQLPRMAKLCIGVIGHEKTKMRTLAWVNIPLFDYNAYLKTGQGLYTCRSSNGSMTQLNPFGTAATCEEDMGISLEIRFLDFEQEYRYPSEDEILKRPVDVSCTYRAKQHRSTIEEILRKDPLAPLFENEKELLWQFRTTCLQDYPDSLPKLLQCVKWKKMDDVIQVYHMLRRWNVEMVSVEVGLDLLDYRYPDVEVRRFAVKVLDTLSDNQLQMYFLQLIQGLKHEMYLESPLAIFLLRRAFNNRKIGHYLFWHLKSEMTSRDYSVQYGLLLELYCRGCGSHLDLLERQVEAINKLKTMTELLQSCKDADRPGCFKEILKKMFDGDGGKVFSNLISPLDPSVQLKRLKIDDCKFMTSAKKPLWLVFENADEGADDVPIIFKNGDDLRQDMLTLLALKLMDVVWKEVRQDYGLIPYCCLSTGPMMGLIEVVSESETLSRIQAGIGTIRGVLKEDSLYTWLQEYCWGDEKKFASCITNFTLSVVGYSVATYVLGVGDRHNDNIMMKYDTGQLFHIDFGHFLGNFKSKFGIRRERVKFILPDEFIYIIERMNKEKTQEENFNTFKNMCTEAFITLRRKGSLIITIFTMLLSTGIPELQHPDDLEYLRDTLAIQKDEKEAEVQFQAAFQEAYDKRGTTSLNFLFHNVKQFWIN